MSSYKFFRQLSTHLLALIFGVGITFGGLKVLSSQAETLPQQTNSEGQSVEVVKVPTVNSSTNFVAAAIAKTGPAVVRIDTESTVTNKVEPMLDDPLFKEFFGDRFSQNNTQERQVRGQGSGFIIDKSGIILTNAHVVSKADKVTVTLKDGREFQGTVKGTDEVTDLAVIKIEPKDEKLTIAALGDSSQLQVGDWAIAVGNPVGLNNTVTLGIISTLERSSDRVGIPDKRIDFLQTDAAINPGNSGGPLLNEKGEVIGINTAIRTDASGIGFAIPINKVKKLQPILATGKKVPHAYMGIQMIALTPEIAKENNADPNSTFIVPEITGVLVVKVLPDTPAQKAGIRRGDVIFEVNGEKIIGASQLQKLVEETGVDRHLKVKIRRGDENIEMTVKTAQLEGVS
jgi:S1-C subfamily serine protease